MQYRGMSAAIAAIGQLDFCGERNVRTLIPMLKDDVLDFLHAHRIRLDTTAGQHFLIREEVLECILAASNVTDADRIVEVGPGIGVLTRELLKTGAHVTAVEIDARFPPLLKAFCGKTDRLDVHLGNALQERMPETPYKVVANIPYHITSPLLHHLLLESPVRPTSLTLLIQKEVADNIASRESDSILSVLTALFGTANIVCTVPHDAFVPWPKVDSAVIHIECYAQPKADLDTARKVLTLAKHAMHQRRKMLRNSVGSLPGGMEAIEKSGVKADRRPQTLTIDEWISLEAALRNTRA